MTKGARERDGLGQCTDRQDSITSLKADVRAQGEVFGMMSVAVFRFKANQLFLSFGILGRPLSRRMAAQALLCFMDFSSNKLKYARDYKDLKTVKVVRCTGTLPGQLPEESNSQWVSGQSELGSAFWSFCS